MAGGEFIARSVRGGGWGILEGYFQGLTGTIPMWISWNWYSLCPLWVRLPFRVHCR